VTTPAEIATALDLARARDEEIGLEMDSGAILFGRVEARTDRAVTFLVRGDDRRCSIALASVVVVRAAHSLPRPRRERPAVRTRPLTHSLASARRT
jgi:hypothetical protein